MKTLKAIGIFLSVLLAIFMLVGMYYGIMLYFWVIKLMMYAAVIATVLIIYFKVKKIRNKKE